MTIDISSAQDILCSHLCSTVRITQPHEGLCMVETPFAFPDGDRYPLYVRPTQTGGLRVSDGGHTFMHLSYETEVDALRKGTRGRLLERIISETGIHEEGGEFYVETSLDGLADAIFRLGQALTQVHDLIFLNRSRTASTFYEDLHETLVSMVSEEKITRDYVETRIENAEDYPIDYHIPGKNDEPLFLFGVPNRDKARLTTIVLERLLRHDLSFDSILVFADQQELPRKDLARLTNVGGEMVASLDAREDLARKISRKAA